MHVPQNDKRQLETAMVVESRLQMKQKGLSKRSLGDTEDSYLASEVRPPMLPCKGTGCVWHPVHPSTRMISGRPMQALHYPRCRSYRATR